MKCPKCHYLSFDPEPRCRNCGYDLELAEDLVLKTAEDAVEGPLADLALRQPDPARRAPITLELVHPARAAAQADARPAAGNVGLAEREPAPVPAPAIAAAASAAPSRAAAAPSRPPDQAPQRQPAPSSTPGELPLFVRGLDTQERSPAQSDAPMVVVPAVPRVPLSVRRGAPEPPRSRTKPAAGVEPKVGSLDRDLLEDLRRVEQEQARETAADRATWTSTTHAARADEASVGTRLAAAAIDALLLGTIAGVVLFATLRVCGLSIAQIAELPPLPLATFQLLVTIGYLLLFTIASGQTVGKMVMGIRVVGAADDARGAVLTVRQAAYRELLSVPLVIGLGAGYMPAVLGRGPTVHDRLAETRVVRE